MPTLIPLALATVLLLGQAPPPAERVPDEVLVTRVLEELRRAELFLDADGLGRFIAHSFTLIEDEDRLTGPVAYIEPIREMRNRHADVKELRFEDVQVRSYGASAIGSYRYFKVTQDRGARRREEGWCTDVFELREGGEWLLVHRHRERPRRFAPPAAGTKAPSPAVPAPPVPSPTAGAR